jgi:hypothetical protein
MRALAVVWTLLLVGCASPAPAATPTAAPKPTQPSQPSQPTQAAPPTVAAAPTPAPKPATAANYQAVVQPMLLPLGALIVAVRGHTPTTTYWVGEFNKAADAALPAIAGDPSPTAERVRTAVANIRA